MGNESSADTSISINPDTKQSSDGNLSNEEEKSRYWHESHKYVSNFCGKWLSHIRLRPIVITNKLYGMKKINKPKIDDDINRLNELFISRFDNMIIHHSGIEITLNSNESYLIFPDYSLIVKDVCMYVKHQKIRQIVLKMSSILEFDDVDVDEFNMYDNNYGYIDNVTFSNSDDINIDITNHGIYDKYLMKDTQFLSISSLPIDVLKIICYQYIGTTTHNDVKILNILNPYIKIKHDKYDYNWICHKLRNNKYNKEKITFYRGINIFGKYFNLETILNVDSCMDNFREMEKKGNQMNDTIIGTSYSRVISRR